MFDNLLGSTSVLRQALNASWLRSEVIAHNIANADTPGFKSSSVKFEDFLKSAMDDTDSGFRARRTRRQHIEFEEQVNYLPMIVQNDSTTMRMDENNVDVEAEMVAQAKNSIYYDFLIRKTTAEIGRIKYAITEGR